MNRIIASQPVVDKMVQLNILCRAGYTEDGREKYATTADFVGFMKFMVNVLDNHPEFMWPELKRELIGDTAEASFNRNWFLASVTVLEFFERSGESIDGPWYHEIVEALVRTTRNILLKSGNRITSLINNTFIVNLTNDTIRLANDQG